jgi:diguanylate cyclase (GGDEF)-like protein
MGGRLADGAVVPADGRSLRDWRIWALPAPALTYVIAVQVTAVAVTVATAAAGATADQWLLCAILTACGVAHVLLSLGVERIRRLSNHAPFTDLLGAWTFAASLLLPHLPLALLFVGVYGTRWWLIGRFDLTRPAHRSLFNAAALLLTAHTVAVFAAATGLHERLTAGGALSAADGLALTGAAALSWTADTVFIGAVILLSRRLRQAHEALGDGWNNFLVTGEILLGAFVALSATRWPWLALLMVAPVVALHRTVLLHQLQIAAHTDDKTGLLNASTWHHRVAAALAGAKTDKDRRFALFMIDLDHFSEVNNCHGHLAGDAVLRQVATMLASSFRRDDSVSRFGGEEFAVLLPDVDRAEALAVATRIHQRMRELRVTHRGTVISGLTTSIGVAVYPDVAEDSVDGLISAADSALYEAKRAGRDQVVLAGERRALPWLPTTRRPTREEQPEVDPT